MIISIPTLIFLALVSFVQNMIFTWTSRSRQSGNPKKHMYAALSSNSVWFLCNYFLLFPEVFKITEFGTVWDKLIIMIVYTVFTALGSVVMMKINLGHYGNIPFFTEKGKDQVGAR